MTEPPGDSGRLEAAFPNDRAALVVYLMAGYPNRSGSLSALRAAASAGADVIELGVPFADPVADGPVIAAAAEEARRAHGGSFGLSETLALAEEFVAAGAESATNAPPVVLMTYFNTLMRSGLEHAAASAANAGVAGVIVPDLPPDSPLAARWREAAATAGVATVFLVAPTSTAERIGAVAQASTGFVYCVSSLGVTGERDRLPDALAELVGRVKASTALPVAVGFGVGSPEQAAAVARDADGVIVGSAAVRRQADPAELGAFVSRLAEAVRAERG